MKTKKMSTQKLLILFSIFILAAGMTTSVFAADEKIHVTTDDHFTHYPHDSVQYPAGYSFDIELENGSVYYIKYDNEEPIAKINPMFELAVEYEVEKYMGDSSVSVNNIFGQKVGSLTIEDDGELFTFPVENEFYITYTDGHKVGLDDNAHEVDKIFDKDGKQLN